MAASVFMTLTLSSNATTVRPLTGLLEQEVRPAKRANTILPSIKGSEPQTEASRLLTALPELGLAVDAERPTTAREKLIGEMRRFTLLPVNWDSEDAAAPDPKSVHEAVSFVRLLDVSALIPESMLLHSGNAALFWHVEGLYADLEFLGDGRIAYFIERQGDKHKGVAKFNSQKMPAVFPALLEI